MAERGRPIIIRLITGITAVVLTIACLSGSGVAAAKARPTPSASTSQEAAPTPTPVAEAVTPENYQPDLAITNTGTSAIVLEMNRQRRLYKKDGDSPMNIPAAAKLMTALIACEQLPLDTLVTISDEVAKLPDAAASQGQVKLQSGSKYPLEYLLLRLFFYDCDAAALAIAEQIASVETNFVAIMNQKAESLELRQTHFVNCTGDPVIKPDAADLPYSTASDVARLISKAMQVPSFAQLISKNSEYLVLEGKTVVSMHNRIAALWTRSENKVTAAFYCENNSQATTITVGIINNMNLVTVIANGNPANRLTDSLALYSACGKAYETSSLVVAGEPFAGGEEKTIDGEVFGLVYLKSIYYVHPINDDFLQPMIQYRSLGPFIRPIQRGLVVGQVIFTLRDGSSIAADVGPNRQILSNISIIDKALNELESNRNLTTVLIICLVILILVLLFHVIRHSVRLVRLVYLAIFEYRSHR